ncbi:hypothetical protein SAMD00023353_0501150 [Rosellinia necatrix]|uniref:Nephrocystin 3-like N-terminal domain-containing protein n=1 Tax=Rosellinia necatrix TaxID=77044 RepID=A0A1S7UKD5_ROSNE|nr:hypothetical protein SAMD00023353_0501150 [Rosellinia necatrix]
MRDRLRERLDSGDLDREYLRREYLDREYLDREYLDREYLDKQRLERRRRHRREREGDPTEGLEDYGWARRRIYDVERERDLDRSRVVIVEPRPDQLFDRYDADVIRERRLWVNDDTLRAEEIVGRERSKAWSTGHLHSRPPPPVLPPGRAPGSHTAALPYTSISPPPSDTILSAHDDRLRDRFRDDIDRLPTVARERRPSFEISVPIIRDRPQSAFATPYPAYEVYHDRNLERERDLQIIRASDGSFRRIERRYHPSSPSLTRRDYVRPMPPPPTNLYVSTPQVTASSDTRASSPAKTITTPAPAAIGPTATDEPGEDFKIREKFLDLVCPHSPDLVHQNLAKARAKDSGGWLFNLPVFEKWREAKIAEDANAMEGGRGNCIWLIGNLGAGKTMLMSAIIDHLVESVEILPESSKKRTAVLYYYFDRSLPSSPRDAIASLLRQLCLQKDIGPLPRFLTDSLAVMKKSPGPNVDSDKNTMNIDEECLAPIPTGDMVADFISLQLRFDSVYICLDGLEECDDLVALFELLVRLIASSPSRLVISARPQIALPGIVANIGSKDIVVALEQHNAPDIQCHLGMYIEKHKSLADMIGPEILPYHIKKLAERSRGNFLAATAEAAELNRLTTNFDVNQYMERPSIGFAELFSQIWSRLNDQPPLHAMLAKRIFYWLSVSRRALTLKELQQAIAIEPEKHRDSQVFHQSERLPPPSLIERVCMGFIQANRVNNSIFTTPSALPFYFYQFIAPFAAEAREYAAKCCVGFMNSEILSKGTFNSQEEYDQMDEKLPFSRYVSQHWGTHFNDFRDGDIQDATERLLENTLLINTMSQMFHVNRPAMGKQRRYDDYPSEFGVQHFGAYFRLEMAFKKWTSSQDWETPKDSWGRKPLHVASTSPSVNSKHVIFDACKDDAFGRAVSAIPPPESETSPIPSIDKESNVTDRNDIYLEEDKGGFRSESVSALPWTWSWTGDATEQLEMQIPFNREDMTALDNQGKTPLHHFIVEWSEDRFLYILSTIFDLHLQHLSDQGNNTGSDPAVNEVELLSTLADCGGRTILDYACLRNVVFVNLVAPASTWSSENIGRAMVVAAADGHIWPLKQLLESVEPRLGTEISTLNLEDAVIEASKRGFTDIVRLLRQQGANINKPEQGKQGMTALHYAAYGSHLETVRYLLIEGANPNCLDELGRSPLFCAFESGNESITSVLIRKGASPNTVNSEGLGSLQLAARNGNLDVAKKLLRFLQGDDRVAVSGSHQSGVESKSPLHFAAQCGHNDIVQLLLDEGLSYDSKDNDGRTPLSYACQAGHLLASRLLLEQKADVNIQDSTGRTPLSYAAAGGHADIVVALTEKSELDPNVVDSEARSPLIYAARNGHGVVAMLLAVLCADAEERASIIRTDSGALSKFIKPPECHKLINTEHADNQGHTARDYLRQAKDDKAVEFLDTMSVYKTSGKPQHQGVDQGQDLDVAMTDAGGDLITTEPDVQASKMTQITEREGAHDVDQDSSETVMVVDKTKLTPLAEESEGVS